MDALVLITVLGILGFLLFLFLGPSGHAQSPLRQSAQSYPTAGAQSQRSRRKWLWLTIGGLVLLVAATQHNSGTNGPASADERIEGWPQVRIVKFDWRTGGFDNIMIADMVVQNHNPFPVKDIEIKCLASGPSGTVISRPSKTIYQRIQTKGSASFDNVNMGFVSSQTEKAGCDIGLVTAERGNSP